MNSQIPQHGLQGQSLATGAAHRPRILPRPIDAVVIPTANRPTNLLGCLNGVIANALVHGHRPEIFIADGSTDPISCSRNEDIARTISRRYSIAIRLIGSTAKHDLIEYLVLHGIDRDLCSFALAGNGFIKLPLAGANRNILLLSTVGKRALSLDDDVVCEFTRPSCIEGFGSSCPRVSGGFEGAPYRYWFFKDESELFVRVPRVDLDLLGVHAEILGSSQIHAGSDIYPEEHSHEGDVVHLTLNGFLGDCGWGTPSRYLFLEDDSFLRLTKDRVAYQALIQSRSIVQLSPKLFCGSNIDGMMAGTFAVSSDVLSPPFPPAGRGEDRVFGRLFSKFHPRGRICVLPFAIGHWPPTKRRFWSGEITRSAGTWDLSTFLVYLLNASELSGDSDTTRISCFGAQIERIGLQSVAEFRQMLVGFHILALGNVKTFLESRLARFSSMNGDSRRDIEAYLRKLVTREQVEDAAIPMEFLYYFEPDRAIRELQTMVYEFGRLLSCWPRMCELSGQFKTD